MTISKMQRNFNKVCEHLMTQQAKALDKDGECRYRYRGKKCAIGCLIPDDMYKRSMEHNGVDTILGKNPDLAALLLPGGKHSYTASESQLLFDLQGVHDFNPVEHWPARLRIVAQRHHLKQPKCTQ